jgi:hypothetical protein
MMIPKFLMNVLTERDNSTICAYRVIAFVAGFEMLAKFIFVADPQFQDFAEGIAAIGVAIAAKNWSEK